MTHCERNDKRSNRFARNDRDTTPNGEREYIINRDIYMNYACRKRERESEKGAVSYRSVKDALGT